MVEAFWGFMTLLLNIAFTLFCVACSVFMWHNIPTSQDMWLAFGAIHGMLIVFVIMVWRYGR